MASATLAPSDEFARVMAEAYAVNDQMNQIVIENLDPRAWRAKPPGAKGRTIAAIFTHMHNIRRKWLRLSAPHLRLPPELDRARCTPKQAKVALAKSAARCSEMLADGEHVETFLRDGWARPWPAGAAMFAYMIAHDAHHRGQICMLAGQLGFPLPEKATPQMWAWESLWKECGFTHPR
jgi:uncharacterized damage-inducible protein DinB